MSLQEAKVMNQILNKDYGAMTSLWQLNILEDSNVFGHGAINDNRENLKQLQAELNKFKRLIKEFPRLNMAKQYIRYKSVLP